MDSETPTTQPPPEDHEALVLEYQRLVARLVRAGLLTPASAIRVTRTFMRERTEGADVRQSLAKLVMEILLAVEDGTIKLGQDYVRLGDGMVAVHLESISRRLFQARRSSLSVREMRRLFRFGDLQFHDVVRGTSERMMFEREGDRRRTVVLDVARAYEFVGSRPPPVPVR